MNEYDKEAYRSMDFMHNTHARRHTEEGRGQHAHDTHNSHTAQHMHPLYEQENNVHGVDAYNDWRKDLHPPGYY